MRSVLNILNLKESFLRELPVRGAVGLTVLYSVGIVALQNAPIGEVIRNWVERPLTFRYRHWLEKDPSFSEQIKIFAYDDKTIGFMNSEDFDLEQWGELLQHFAEGKPRAIFIDKIFGTPVGRSGYEKFVNLLNSFDFPIIVGSYISYVDLQYRPPLPMSRPLYEPNQYWSSKESYPRWLNQEIALVYGPSEEVYPAFQRVGHLLYDGSFFFRPVIRVLKDRILWGAPFLASEHRRILKEGVETDQGFIPVDSHGRVLVNLPSLPLLYSKTYTLASSMEQKQKGLPPKRVNPGDLVVILPALYTGNSDRAATPMGTIPGGYVMISLFNSVLTHQWVKRMPWEGLATPLLGIFGLLLGGILSGWWLTAFIPITALASLGAMAIFAYFSLEVAWFFPSVNLCLCTVSTFLLKLRKIEDTSLRVRSTLEGVISKGHLKKIMQHTLGVALQPRGQVITVMFVDMVGFSKSVKHLPARDAFAFLKARTVELSNIVHKHGGFIDKSLGDGLLCFFGYQFDGSPSDDHQAKEAVLCGMEMQQHVAKHIVTYGDCSSLPLRIGINTTEAFVGDLGMGQRIDLTVIGSGVNLAQRLEAACEPFRLLLGEATYAALKADEKAQFPLVKRAMKVKHETRLFDAYECNPFAANPQCLEDAEAIYREQFSLNRKSHRVVATGIAVTTDWGEGTLRDISDGELGIDLSIYLCPGVSASLRFHREDAELSKRLSDAGLGFIVGVVRHGRPKNDGAYTHGFHLTNLSPEQRKLLMEILVDATALKAA